MLNTKIFALLICCITINQLFSQTTEPIVRSEVIVDTIKPLSMRDEQIFTQIKTELLGRGIDQYLIEQINSSIDLSDSSNVKLTDRTVAFALYFDDNSTFIEGKFIQKEIHNKHLQLEKKINLAFKKIPVYNVIYIEDKGDITARKSFILSLTFDDNGHLTKME
jgi:hypothetical protein